MSGLSVVGVPLMAPRFDTGTMLLSTPGARRRPRIPRHASQPPQPYTHMHTRPDGTRNKGTHCHQTLLQRYHQPVTPF